MRQKRSRVPIAPVAWIPRFASFPAESQRVAAIATMSLAPKRMLQGLKRGSRSTCPSLTFLGTSGGVPKKGRGCTATSLNISNMTSWCTYTMVLTFPTSRSQLDNLTSEFPSDRLCRRNTTADKKGRIDNRYGCSQRGAHLCDASSWYVHLNSISLTSKSFFR